MAKVSDFSQWQGADVDFVKLKSEVDFVILRVGHGMLSDTQYTFYAAQCKAHGIPFGTYLYDSSKDLSSAQAEAHSAYGRVSKDSQFFALDLETFNVKSASDVALVGQAVIDEMHALGLKKVGLYSGEYFYKEYGLSKVKADFLWLAKYPSGDNGTEQDSAKPTTSCDLWQYTEKGHLDAVPSNYVDLDVLEGRLPLSFFTGIVPVAPKPVAPVAPPAPKPVAKPVAKPAPKPVAPKPAVFTRKTYKIVAGDTFDGIAKKTGVPSVTLQKLNPSAKATALQIGASIYLN